MPLALAFSRRELSIELLRRQIRRLSDRKPIIELLCRRMLANSRVDGLTSENNYRISRLAPKKAQIRSVNIEPDKRSCRSRPLRCAMSPGKDAAQRLVKLNADLPDAPLRMALLLEQARSHCRLKRSPCGSPLLNPSLSHHPALWSSTSTASFISFSSFRFRVFFIRSVFCVSFRCLLLSTLSALD